MRINVRLVAQAHTKTDKTVVTHPFHAGGVLLDTPAGLGHLLLLLLSNPLQFCYPFVLLLQILQKKQNNISWTERKVDPKFEKAVQQGNTLARRPPPEQAPLMS